jgi:hypothetical protein
VLETWVIRCLYCNYERFKDPRQAYLAAPEPVHGPDEHPWYKEAIRQASAFQSRSLYRELRHYCPTWGGSIPLSELPPDVWIVQKPIAPATEDRIEEESELKPILTNADAWDPADFGKVLHAVEPSGQLNLLERDVSEPPDPDDYEGDMFAFHAAYDRWLLTSEIQEIIHPNDFNDLPTTERTGTQRDGASEISRDNFASSECDICSQHDGASLPSENHTLGSQKGDRILENARHGSGDSGRIVPRQSAQLTGRCDGRGDLDLAIGMLVGRRRDRQHIGKILDIYRSRRGIWRAKIQPLNKSNFVYYDCAALIEQRLLYDYEMNPGGFVPTGEIFNKKRCENFDVYSRKVRSPAVTNWTADELNSLSIFKLKQIARDMQIQAIPGTAGKRSLIRAILAEQAILQEKLAAQRERETGRSIAAQKQKTAPARKKRAAAPLPGNQLSLFGVTS